MVSGAEPGSKKIGAEREPNPVRVMWALLGGVVGGAAVLFLQTGHLSLKPVTMTFEEFTGILLAAVALIVTVFGVVLAVFAFWGFSQLRKDVATLAIQQTKDQVDQIIQNEIKSPEFERRVWNRVDEIVLGNAERDRRDRDLDANREEDEGGDA